MKVVFDNLANFLSISPNQTPVFAVCLLGPSWIFLPFPFLPILYSLPYLLYVTMYVHVLSPTCTGSVITYGVRAGRGGGEMATIDTTSRQTWQNVNSKRRMQRIQNGQEGKRHQKKRHKILSFHICVVTTAFLFVPSVFGEKFPTAEF